MTMTLKLAATALCSYVSADIPVMLSGPPGVGKSEVVYQVAERLKYNVVDLRVSRMDPVDLHGLPIQDVKSMTTKWLPPDALPDEKRDGLKGLLFLDELPHASEAMQKACFGLVLERRLGKYVLPKGWVPIAAGNRIVDRAGVIKMPTPLRNRFAHIEVAVDLESWVEWANRNNIHALVSGFIRWKSELLHMMPQGEDNAFPTPRAWAKVSLLAEADESIRQHLVEGLVGPGPAGEFESFCRTYARLPSMKEILTSPKTARVPPADEPGVYYAVASAVSKRATADNLANIVTYMNRLPKEFEVFMMTDAVHRDKTLTDCKAFANWSIDNQEVVSGL